MGYQMALEAAGATVHCFGEFGSYQGDWWAKVTYKGETGWVQGCYGSCSGCDAFQAEFDYMADKRCEEHRFDSEATATCPECASAPAKYQQRLVEFGRSYLDDLIITQEQAEKVASEHLSWDSDAQEMINFIKENA